MGPGGRGEWGAVANRYGVSFGDDGNILELEVMVAAHHNEYSKNHWSMHFKMVTCMLYEIYLKFKKYYKKPTYAGIVIEKLSNDYSNVHTRQNSTYSGRLKSGVEKQWTASQESSNSESHLTSPGLNSLLCK